MLVVPRGTRGGDRAGQATKGVQGRLGAQENNVTSAGVVNDTPKLHASSATTERCRADGRLDWAGWCMAVRDAFQRAIADEDEVEEWGRGGGVAKGLDRAKQ